MGVLFVLALATSSPAAFDAQVYKEVVAMRRSPQGYAAKLRAYRARFEGKLVKVEGRADLLTREGVAPVDEAIKVLQRTKALPALALSRGLSRAARDHALDLSKSGRISHQGSDGSRPDQRIDRHGRWEGTVGENLSFANVPADEVITMLLIDDGVPGRGHRNALLDPRFRMVGVACAPHRLGKVCVITFAAGFKEK